MIFMGLTYWKRHSYPTNMLFLSGFTLLEAYTISVIVSFYKTLDSPQCCYPHRRHLCLPHGLRMPDQI